MPLPTDNIPDPRDPRDRIINPNSKAPKHKQVHLSRMREKVWADHVAYRRMVGQMLAKRMDAIATQENAAEAYFYQVWYAMTEQRLKWAK